MATAVQPSAAAREPDPRARLATSGLLGGAVVVAGVAAVGYVLPAAWRQYVSPALAAVGPMADALLRVSAQAVLATAVAWLWGGLGGSHPPKGLRGGIFAAVSALATAFFLARAVGLWAEEAARPVAAGLTAGTAVGVLFAAYRLMTRPAAHDWMQAIDQQGLLHATRYKRSQGQVVRRYTLLGLLLVGWTGVYTMYTYTTVGTGPLTLRLPFVADPVAALPDVEYTVPLLAAALVFWLSWRAVNAPAFADFLIATEAELNKVSWPTRKGLVQDTVVVLVTTGLMVAFLLFVDLFWGWLLSREVVGVLPSDTAKTAAFDPVLGKKSEW